MIRTFIFRARLGAFALIVHAAFTLVVSDAAAAPAAKYTFVAPSERNVVYGMDHGAALLLDVYRPAASNGYALIFIMGTGFTASGEYNDVPLKELNRYLVDAGIFPPLFGGKSHAFSPALEAGFTVFTINHRLAPAHTWKTMVRDCQRAVQWIRAHAQDYRINPAAIGGLGHSSGATLTTFLAVSDDVADPQAADPVNRQSSRIQAAVAFSGLHDLLAYREERPALAGMLSTLTGRTIMFETPDHPIFATYREASTISHVTKDDAPMLVFHGDADVLVDVRQAQALDRALTRAGVPHELIILPGADHGQLKQPMQPTPVDHAATWLIEQLKKTSSR